MAASDHLQLRLFVPAGELADHSQYESTDLPAMVRSPQYPMVNNIEQAQRHKVKETMQMGLHTPPVAGTDSHDPAPDGYLGAYLPKKHAQREEKFNMPVTSRSMYQDIKERGVTTPVPVQINPSDVEGVSPFILTNGNHRVQAAARIDPNMLVPVTWEDAPGWDEFKKDPATGQNVPANASHRNIVKDMDAKTERMMSNRSARQKHNEKKKR